MSDAPLPASASEPEVDLRFRSRAGQAWERLWREAPGAPTYWLTRFLVLRLLGLVYLMAFLSVVNDGRALIGGRGLLPVGDYLERIADRAGGRWAGFLELPSIFWIGHGDGALLAAGLLGLALSAVVLAGYANALMLLVLWALQLSVANVGQTFYAFGWEMQLAETGFLCAFLCPLLDGRPFPRRAPPLIVVWLLRWLIARIMLGAGLIKLRGDPCWTDLTCLDYHFETQPVPGPLTPLYHALPRWAHKLGVLFNHLCELVAPVFAFGPRRARHVAGALFLALQLVLISSGNLSFLNWLTIVPVLACFDDGLLGRLLPALLVARAQRARAAAAPSRPQRVAVAALAVVVALFSVEPVLNLFSGHQLMNASFDRLNLVNTYGAFGSVGRERLELIFEGTRDEVLTADTRWEPYEWKCKPGDPDRRPCLMSPYHYRLDWLIWFAAMGDPGEYPWAVHLVARLLEGDRATLDLLARDPFAGAPPRHLRVELYRYRLAPLRAAPTWQRTRLGEWLPPLARDDPRLQGFLRRQGWAP
jgi:hypothetical protein